MEERCSDFFTLNNYIGTKRGRYDGLDMGWEMFPEKTARTDMIEDPAQIYNLRRESLMDYTPEDPLFADEFPVRDKRSHMRINLREGAPTLTDPWRDVDYDIQFHDKDPRGYLTEQPWSEFRRQAAARAAQKDFKDDGDYSVPSMGIHPNSMYKQIRVSQDWLKSRMKVFATSLENFQNGGVGVYPHMSQVYTANVEDTTVNMDALDWNAKPINPYTNFNVSNYLHMGSKNFRVNTTPDQHVKVSTYNKLYRNQGLLPHESQLRILEDDTKFMVSKEGMHKNMVRLMNLATGETNHETSKKTSFFSMRNGEEEKFAGMKRKEMETVQGKSNLLTKDVMALLGFTSYELKKIERMAQTNKKKAKLMLANLAKMTETVHKLPANVKLSLKDDLIRRKGVIQSGDLVAKQENYAVDNKVVRQLEQKTSGTGPHANPKSRKLATESDAKLKRTLEMGGIYRSAKKENVRKNANQASVETRDKTKQTISFKGLAPVAPGSDMGINTQFFTDAGDAPIRKTTALGDLVAMAEKINVDNEFGENKSLDRHGGGLGSKYTRKDMIAEDYTNDMDDVESKFFKRR